MASWSLQKHQIKVVSIETKLGIGQNKQFIFIFFSHYNTRARIKWKQHKLLLANSINYSQSCAAYHLFTAIFTVLHHTDFQSEVEDYSCFFTPGRKNHFTLFG